MYTLFGHKGCGSAAIEIALDLAQVEYQYIDAASWVENDALQALAEVNPLQQIPTLVLPDHSIMTESAAILIHLGMKYPESGLLPANTAAAAQVIRGLVFLAANCYSAISIIDYPERWLASPVLESADGQESRELAPKLSEYLREGSKKRLYYHWSLFIQSFPVSPYFSGVSLGALDILAAVISRWSGTREYLQHHHADAYELLRKIDGSAPCEAVITRHFEEIF
ncbi:hypothetical protein TDB9533_02933 [Thalassocella blandensis]|nr:hypothetical protein TDB9533_02933 [Thalassocella blandensis]